MKQALIQRSRQLIAADPWRKSRLHDMRGNFVGTQALFTDLPRSLKSAAVRELAGRYPELPWIPYPAIAALAEVARPTWRVLEHGAGMSTVWWAQRVASLHSIDASTEWYRRIMRELSRRGVTNVTLELRTDDTYADLSMFPDHAFNLVVIDGHARDEAARQAPRLITRPGWIYLDNTDFAAEWQSMYGEAEDELRSAAMRDGASMRYFTGLAPGTVVASQGLLIAYP